MKSWRTCSSGCHVRILIASELCSTTMQSRNVVLFPKGTGGVSATPSESVNSFATLSKILSTWTQCLLASHPMCWSCGGSGSAEASLKAFSVRVDRAEWRVLNQTFASVLSDALSQHSCTPSGEWSSKIRPSET